MHETLRVIGGDGRRSAATWGQDYMLERIALLEANAASSNLYFTVAVPLDTNIADVGGVCRTLVRETEALRTMFVEQGLSGAEQQVEREVDVSVYYLAGDQIEQITASLRNILLAMPFDLSRAELVRFGVGLNSSGEPRSLTVVVSHSVSDAHSILLLRRQVQQLLTAPGRADRLLPHAVDYQERERTESVVGRSDRAISRWLGLLDSSETLVFDTGPKPLWRYGKWDSARYKHAARSVARTLAISTSSIHMWLLATVAQQLLGLTEVTIVSRYANRDSTNRLMIGQLHQEVPIKVQPDGRHPLDDTLRHIHASLIASYRYAHYDFAKYVARALQTMTQKERLTRFSIVFNDLSGLGDDTEGNDLTKDSSFRWLANLDHDISTLYFSPAGIGNFDWLVDTRALGDRSFVDLLSEIEEDACKQLNKILSC